MKRQSLESSDEKKKGHQTRVDRSLSKDCETGADFPTRDHKWRAKYNVIKEIEKSSGKQLSRA